jgi:stage II sporulation protein D
MIIRIFLFLLAFLPFSFSAQAAWWDPITDYFRGGTKAQPPTIRILIVHDVDGLNLEVYGKYSLYDPYTNSYISSRFTGKSRYLEALSDGLKWGEAFPGLYQLKIKPDEAAARTIINGHEYKGEIYIYDIGGTISIVNQIPVEEYVRSIVATQSNRSLDPETLAALAITARTYAYFHTMNPKNTYWMIDAQKVGYNGHNPVPQIIEEALNVTRYMIMSRTGVYEGMATPFAAQFEAAVSDQPSKEVKVAEMTVQEANELAHKGAHAAQILAKAFPGTVIILMEDIKTSYH